MKKAVVAMSGGVDSSVTAFLMKEKGYDCKGVTMRLFEKEGLPCCSSDDIEDARKVAERLSMPYEVFDFKADFKRCVIDKFISAYECGATPNPCIECNRYLKFELLFNRANEDGLDKIATGHYARIEKQGDRYLLKKAKDLSKDQSYVLFSLTPKMLAKTVFPLGEYTKSEVREIAEANGFVNARKHDSQDICFVPDGDYAKVIEGYTKKTYPKGNFIDHSGNVLGEHKGIIRYTIGQRKGLGLSLPEPLYVVEKRMDTNEVVLGKNERLFTTEFDVYDINWIGFDKLPEKFRASSKVRYRQVEQPSTVFVTGENTAHVVFDEPQRAITSGQACVFYDGEYVLGGGTIK